jgi:drug/metabolite transporter (DMT)-like permease
MSWITLSIVAALVWSISNIIDKFLLTKWSIRPILPVLAIGIIDLIVSTSIFVLHPVPLLPIPLLLLAFLAGCCYFFNMYLYFYAVKGEDISTVIPLLYLSPLWVALIAHFFLGETLHFQQYIALCLLIAGAILLSVNSLKMPRMNKALLAVILACLCFAINQAITKYLLQHTDTLSAFAYIRASAFLAMIPLFLINFNLLSDCNQQNGYTPMTGEPHYKF